MPWQPRAAELVTEYDPDTGLSRFGTVIVTVQRQAGKTELEGGVADTRGFVHPGHRARITMQDGKTADEWMREQYLETVENVDLFDGRFISSRRAGSHGIKWWNGSTFNTFPPTRRALHSKQTDLGILDEVWVHDLDVGRAIRQGLRPTMNTRRLAQLWIVSTLGDDRSEFLNEYVARGVASLDDPDSRVCFIDYGVPDDADVERLDVIAAHHPAYGHTLSMRALEDARTDFIDEATGILDLAGFARAYGNRQSAAAEIVFPESVWTAAGEPRPLLPERAGLGLDASPDGARFALAAGWRDGAGTGHVEIVANGPIRRDTPAHVAAVARARRVPILVDRQAQAALEITDAFARLDERDRPDVEFLSTAQYGSACVTFQRGIFAGASRDADAGDIVRHPNDPDLDAAVRLAVRRRFAEGGFGWGRAGSAGSIVELVAATIALRAFELLPAARRRPVAHAGI
jgi:hypothetical protein